LKEKGPPLIEKKHLKIKGLGKLTYDGEWENDKPHGFGVFFLVFLIFSKIKFNF